MPSLCFFVRLVTAHTAYEACYLWCRGLARHQFDRDLGALEVGCGAPTMQHLGNLGVGQYVVTRVDLVPDHDIHSHTCSSSRYRWSGLIWTVSCEDTAVDARSRVCACAYAQVGNAMTHQRLRPIAGT